MALVDGRGIEVIDRAGCLELLAGQEVGRIGIIDGGSPLVLPVNFALDGEAVVFRTGPGSKLQAARGRAACFEIDGVDADTRSGWSVVVRGRLQEVTRFDGDLHDRIVDLAEPWIEGQRGHVVRLQPHSISGRRIRPA